MASGTWAAERWHCPRLALTALARHVSHEAWARHTPSVDARGLSGFLCAALCLFSNAVAVLSCVVTAEKPGDVQDRCGLFCEITSAPQDRCGLGCGRHAGHPGSLRPFVPDAPRTAGIGAAFLPPPRLTSRIGVAFCSEGTPDDRDRGCLFVRPLFGQPGSGSPFGRHTPGTARIGAAGTPSWLRTVRIASAVAPHPSWTARVAVALGSAPSLRERSASSGLSAGGSRENKRIS